MQTTEIRFVVLFLFLYNSVEAKLSECGEFDPNGVVARKIDEYSEELPFQDELEEVFEAFEKNDDERMEEAFKSLENVEIDEDEAENYGVDLVKFVVRTISSTEISN